MTNPSKSKRPYLIRAMHEWMGDNGHTPHIVIDASVDGVTVPTEHIKDGKIILNISHSAAHNLKLTGDAVSFRARFSGVPFDVWVPMKSVLGKMSGSRPAAGSATACAASRSIARAAS